ncbi:cyanobactin maturation PatA/PatG family protease [Streptosporangium becharense]|uniref:Cyanobactin maturation PatA/PatG family protease n=1 Tax=Streptosporangium becharense TaxID=1816182 RepID=A0A7W9IA73_9ACTN|nr:PatA/PatG family cyanobactin maturation protease [Streptosporangium becharense]MBB2915320.1 cyanobactin maturation PatA/PatG family protease [Streptosporangium becharense]MBB5816982.1 cyanobactin maturation PatA/PatG family protease [Streptosporangium becharense]
MGEVSAVTGLARLWDLTTGDDHIGVAVVDGPVDDRHPVFAEGKLTQPSHAWPGDADSGTSAAHGTAVAGVLFGRHDGPVPGVAPACRAVSVPVFARGRRTSQLELARAIELAADSGVHVINVSGGQLAGAEEAEDVLTRAIDRCRERNVLVVAAVGNDGCFCDHVPASLPGVLAVGACDEAGRPLPTSNFGPGSRRQGLLAPGHDILVAVPGGGTTRMSGTSLAAPIVAGVAALLLSLQRRRGDAPDPGAVGRLLLESATPCDTARLGDGTCARHLAGTLDITKAVNAVTTTSAPISSPDPAPAVDAGERAVTLSCGTTLQSATDGQGGCDCAADDVFVPAAVTAPTPAARPWAPAATAPAPQTGVVTSAEQGKPAARRLVYALGTLGYDFGTEARRDTFKQLMPPVEADGVSLPANPYDPRQMVDYLRENPSEARPLIWTLNLDLTPIYAVEPVGGYAPGVYERLTEFLARQLKTEDDVDFVDRVSVPGALPGRTVKLFSGQVVPVIEINLTRGLYGWSVAGLAHAVTQECQVPQHNQRGNDNDRARLTDAVSDFLTRIYYDLRNFGATSRDRALNFAATNAVQARQTLAEALGRGMALQNIEVEKSPYGRPDSDCWDVKLRFFDPDNSKRAKRVYRFTVDVKDVMPVTLGPVRSWPEA